MKNLKKLVAISAAALTLAGVGATTANAAIVVGGVTYDPRNVQIENMSQAEYLAFIQDVAGQINTNAAQRDAKRTAIANAQSAYDAAEEAYNEAVAERNELRADLDAAIADRNAKQARVDELAEVLRLTNRDFAAEKQAAAEALEDALAANVYTYNKVVRDLQDTTTAAENALASANQELQSAQADVDAYAAAEVAGTPWTQDEIVAADARLATAISAQGTAAANLSAAQAAETNGIANAAKQKDAADVTAQAEYDQTIRNIEAAYTDAQNIYKEAGIQGDAQAAYDKAVAAADAAVAKVTELQTALATAEGNVNTTLAAKDAAYATLRNAQRDYARLERHISELELALHQAVVDGNINSNTNLGEITKEEMETIDRVRGTDSKELEDQLADAEKNVEDLEEEQDNDVPGNQGPDTDEDGNTVPGESTDDEETSDDESESDDEDDNNNGGSNNGNGSNNGGSNSGSGQAELPETGESSSYAIFGAAALAVLAGVGLVAPSFKKEN